MATEAWVLLAKLNNIPEFSQIWHKVRDIKPPHLLSPLLSVLWPQFDLQQTLFNSQTLDSGGQSPA